MSQNHKMRIIRNSEREANYYIMHIALGNHGHFQTYQDRALYLCLQDEAVHYVVYFDIIIHVPQMKPRFPQLIYL